MINAENGITRASRIAGGQAALAKKLNAGARGGRKHVSQQAISQWIRQGYVPTDRAIEISECVNCRVKPVELVDPKLAQIMNYVPPITSGE
jgi:hypothetical protein